MKRSRLLPSRYRGSAVTLALIAIFILLATGAGLLSLEMKGRIYSTQNARCIQARCAADSGLARALVDLNGRLRTNPEGIDAAIGAIAASK